MHIEQATLKHLDAVSGLFDRYRQFYRQPPDAEGAHRFIEERMRNGDAHILCAIADGDVAGFAQLYPFPDSIAMAPAWLLHDLYVDEAFRRRGIARRLLHAVRAVGERSAASVLTLATGINNTSAQALYESEGWTRDDEYYYYDLHLR